MADIKDLKEYASIHNVPIMQEDGIDFLTTFIIKKQIKNVLEVGTAIGYSAIMMARCNKDVHITTIERDETRYMEALKNIKKLDEEFDLIFIDAAKGKNKDFFEHFENNLTMNGYIITDNMYFHGYVEKDESEITSKNILGIVRKIKDYTYFLENHMLYKTTIYDIGDGIAVTERRG